MKATIESTNLIQELLMEGVPVKCRVWQGTSESGVDFDLFVVGMGVATEPTEAQKAELLREFQRIPPPLNLT